jgi:hypothetical protein
VICDDAISSIDGPCHFGTDFHLREQLQLCDLPQHFFFVVGGIQTGPGLHGLFPRSVSPLSWGSISIPGPRRLKRCRVDLPPEKNLVRPNFIALLILFELIPIDNFIADRQRASCLLFVLLFVDFKMNKDVLKEFKGDFDLFVGLVLEDFLVIWHLEPF